MWGCPTALVVLLLGVPHLAANASNISMTTPGTATGTTAAGASTTASNATSATTNNGSTSSASPSSTSATIITTSTTNASTASFALTNSQPSTPAKHEAPVTTPRTKHASTATAKHGKVRGRLLEDADVVTPTTTEDSGTSSTPKVVPRAALTEWEEFKRKNNKTYPSREDMKRMSRAMRGRALIPTPDTHSDEDRMDLFMGRKMAIEEFNKQPKSFKRALNQFADLTPQEVVARHTGLLLTGRKPKGALFDPRAMGRLLASQPRRFDWREKGALPEPKNQGTCGCCWAFAATAALEARSFMRTRYLVALSEQHLLDCDTLDEKCEGGTPWDAFDWVQANGGLEENVFYPYEVLPDRCRQDKSRLYHLPVRGYMSVRPATEDNIITALVTEGPLTVAVNANLATFQDYREGVYFDPECDGAEENLRHAMVLVGYGDDPVDGPYWTLRNSWGREWGELGHIRVSRRDNLCGITTYAVFPVLNDAV